MPLRNATCEAIEQVLELINSAHNHYSQSPDNQSASIGRHVRHIIDHFLAFRTGVASGCIDYNVRHRDSLYETQPQLAKETLTELADWLKNCELNQGDITVISEISVSHNESTRLTSNYQRELTYLINHTIHHVAYASLLARLAGIDTADYLGLAPATATHLREQAEAACAQ